MKFPFNRNLSPPMPVLDVVLRNDLADLSIGPMEALVDTGADGTVVPVTYLREIKAPVVGRARLHYHLGVRDVVLHIADVQIGELVFPGQIIVADREGRELILGRDVLNCLCLLIDGPEQITQVRR
jgi:predicted aspartyl protease